MFSGGVDVSPGPSLRVFSESTHLGCFMLCFVHTEV